MQKKTTTALTSLFIHCMLQKLTCTLLQTTRKDQEFWMQADPDIDAWMLVTGRKRDVFDITTFVDQHRAIVPEVQNVRNIINVLVLMSRCPVTKALRDLERSERGEEPVSEPEVPSQSYWTTIKKWRPW